MNQISVLQKERLNYKPLLPKVLQGKIKIIEGNATTAIKDEKDIEALFPRTYGMPIINFVEGDESINTSPAAVGVVLSGGQAPGGHNVIAGIFDGLKRINKHSKLYGFMGGLSGLVNQEYIEITDIMVDQYRNTGGFDIIGSGRTKIESSEQFEKVKETSSKLNLSAIIIVGGDDSNTNACLLGEYCISTNFPLQVIGCPKTIDGDLKNEQIETSFGFDTATKVYSELIGNVLRDANSAKKYWHFIKLMGRSASHIALECALQTQPNICIISEEVYLKKYTLLQIIDYIADIISKRADKGENFGAILIPEGLIEFVPEMRILIDELNDILAKNNKYFISLPTDDDKFQYINSKMSNESSKIFNLLPEYIKIQFLADRDPHGNVQVSRIDTDHLLSNMVSDRLREMKAQGIYRGNFSIQNHFFGYEGRCAIPSNFDTNYCYSLGYTASMLIAAGKTCYMVSVRNLHKNIVDWMVGGVPFTMMMNMEKRSGKMKPVIRKALVDLDGKAFQKFASKRYDWAINTRYIYPGPIQFFGPPSVCNNITETLRIEKCDR